MQEYMDRREDLGLFFLNVFLFLCLSLIVTLVVNTVILCAGNNIEISWNIRSVFIIMYEV